MEEMSELPDEEGVKFLGVCQPTSETEEWGLSKMVTTGRDQLKQKKIEPAEPRFESRKEAVTHIEKYSESYEEKGFVGYRLTESHEEKFERLRGI